MKTIFITILDGLTYKDLAGFRQPRAYTVISALILILLFTVAHRAGQLENPIGKSGLAVIDMRDDGKVADVLHGHLVGSVATAQPLKKRVPAAGTLGRTA